MLVKSYLFQAGILISALLLINEVSAEADSSLVDKAAWAHYGFSESNLGSAQEFSKIRPRLLIDERKVALLRSKRDSDQYSRFTSYVLKRARQYAALTLPSSMKAVDAVKLRKVGNRLPFLAMGYLLTNEPEFLGAVLRWMDYLASDSNWPGEDLDEALALTGMAIAYDWLFDSYSEGARNRYKQTITDHAESLFGHFEDNDVWWASSFLQGHNYVNAMALGLAGLVLLGQDDRAVGYLAAADRNFEAVIPLLSPDGASHEGVNYSSLGAQRILIFEKAAAPILGLERIRHSAYFQNLARFRLYASVPGYASIANYADSYPVEFNHSGANLRVLASVFQDEHSQWLANRLDKALGEDAQLSWLDVVWYDPGIGTAPPFELPLYAYFSNLGIFIARSDWTDDATWTFFKAGPTHGWLAANSGRRFVGSHIHPDAGGYLLWANRQWWVPDDGYVLLKKSENHSILRVNGFGQLGGGQQWFNSNETLKYKASASIEATWFGPNSQILQANLTKMYPPEVSLKNWRRTFVWLDNRYVIVRDDVELNAPGSVELLTHLTEAEIRKTGDGFLFETDKGKLLITEISENPSPSVLEDYRLEKSANSLYLNLPEFRRKVMRLQKHNATHRSITLVLRPSPSGRKPGEMVVSWRGNGSILDFSDSKFNGTVDFERLSVTTE